MSDRNGEKMPSMTDTPNRAETPSETAARVADDERIAADERSVIGNVPVNDWQAMAVVDGDPADNDSEPTERE